ncbi:hypothetical protein [Clostridioides sp. ZZV15-6383]
MYPNKKQQELNYLLN